jgi:hypothetical protein
MGRLRRPRGMKSSSRHFTRGLRRRLPKRRSAATPLPASPIRSRPPISSTSACFYARLPLCQRSCLWWRFKCCGAQATTEQSLSRFGFYPVPATAMRNSSRGEASNIVLPPGSNPSQHRVDPMARAEPIPTIKPSVGHLSFPPTRHQIGMAAMCQPPLTAKIFSNDPYTVSSLISS